VLAAPALTAAVRFLGATLGGLLVLGAAVASDPLPLLATLAATGAGLLFWTGGGAGCGEAARVAGAGATGGVSAGASLVTLGAGAGAEA
jgi:hypothetical protein